MKNIIKTLSVISCFILFNCDDKINSLEELNLKPSIEYFSRQTTSWTDAGNDVIMENAKIYNDNNNANFSVALRSNDFNNNFESITISESKNGGLFFIDNEPFDRAKVVSLDSFSLAFRFYAKDIRRFTIKSTDDFGKFKETAFEINFVENEPPIASLEVRGINDISINEYVLDAVSSVDEDSDIGGFIVEYEYNIDNEIISSAKESIKHVFTIGTHFIKLRVKDNDGVWSSQVTETIIVN